VNEMFEHVLQDVQDSAMVGAAIRNEINQCDKTIGISLRRRDQISGNVIWSVFEKVSQSNSRFNALDTLTLDVHSVRKPVGFGFRGDGLKTKGRPLHVIAHLKKSIIEVKTETNCLAHALNITIAKITNDPDYTALRKGRKIRPVVDNLLATTGINLHNGEGILNSRGFKTISNSI
jgi:hypothetical protein